MDQFLQALKSRTVLKAIGLGLLSIITAILTEFALIAVVGIIPMVADIFLRSVTTVPLSEK